MQLRDRLTDWTDWDGAAYALGQALGLFEGEDFTGCKWVFWTENPLGDGLHEALLTLAAAGVLDRRDERDEQFRWNAVAGRPSQV